MLIPPAAKATMIENGTASRKRECDHYPLIHLYSRDGKVRYFLTEIDDHDTDLVYGLRDTEDETTLDYFSISVLEAEGRRGRLHRDSRFAARFPLTGYVAQSRNGVMLVPVAA